MTKILRIAFLPLPVLLLFPAASRPQTAGTPEKNEQFEAASIRTAEPTTGFHFPSSSNAGTGGPGTSDPGMFRCQRCTIAALIGKAFDLRTYQFPASAALPGNEFEIMARVPAGTSQEEFLIMMQNLLKQRFGLAYHFEEKGVRGYQLTVGKGGPKLAASGGAAGQSSRDNHGYGQGSGHSHSGVLNFNGRARYSADQQTMGEFVRVLSDELGQPVDDETGLAGKYDIALTWSSDNGAKGHSDSGPNQHSEHWSGASSGGAGAPADTAPGLSDALQSQLGLKLVAAEKAMTRVLVVDHVDKLPTAN
jgi:uncharacterized protein (TIGR03435 family)